MKVYESTSASQTEANICDNKIQLVKLVHNERKSIKQAAKYLGLKYSTAKKVIKKFRKGKKEPECVSSQDNGIVLSLFKEVQFFEDKLKYLYSTLRQNQLIIDRLVYYCKNTAGLV